MTLNSILPGSLLIYSPASRTLGAEFQVNVVVALFQIFLNKVFGQSLWLECFLILKALWLLLVVLLPFGLGHAGPAELEEAERTLHLCAPAGDHL